MVNRFQVSLTVLEDETAEFINSLKKQKRLKTDIVRFLTKYAQDPEQVDLWLNEDEYIEDDQEDERLLKLKSSLEVFKTFVDIAKQGNEDSLESFTDYLTDEEFHRFRTKFENSQQIQLEVESDKLVETLPTVKEIERDSEKVVELTDQVNALKMMVSELATNQEALMEQIKTNVTQVETELVHDPKVDLEEKEVTVEENLIVTKDSSSELKEDNKKEEGLDDSLKSVIEDSSEALDILAGLGL